METGQNLNVLYDEIIIIDVTEKLIDSEGLSTDCWPQVYISADRDTHHPPSLEVTCIQHSEFPISH